MNDRPDIRLADEGLAIVTPRTPAKGQFTIIDTLRFSTQEMAFPGSFECVTPDEMASKVTAWLRQIFGFGYVVALDKGRDFYLWSYCIGDTKAPLGHFSFGGHRQRGTISFYLTGLGCTHASEGWEQRLFAELSRHQDQGIAAHLTRIDIAYDDTAGLLNPRQCVPLLRSGGFDRFSNRPHVQQFGDWLGDDPRDKGLTFNLGTRHASQLLRVYEKNKQLGINDMTWNRTEVQFSAHARILPLDMLLDPSAYFLAAYPCFSEVFGHLADTVFKQTEKKQKTAKATLEHLEHYAAIQVGALLNALIGLGRTPEQVVHGLRSWTNKLPRRLEAITPLIDPSPGCVEWSPA
jgi:phage replication initiation protein